VPLAGVVCEGWRQCALAVVFLREGHAVGAASATADEAEDGRCFAAIKSHRFVPPRHGPHGHRLRRVVSGIFVVALLVLLTSGTVPTLLAWKSWMKAKVCKAAKADLRRCGAWTPRPRRSSSR